MLLIFLTDKYVETYKLPRKVDRIQYNEFTILLDKENYQIKKSKSGHIIISQFQGVIPNFRNINEIDEVNTNLINSFKKGNKSDLIEAMNSLDELLDGKYILLQNDNRYVIRDILGLQSLYFTNGDVFSSRKKDLWKRKKTHIYSTPPNIRLNIINSSLSPVESLLKLPNICVKSLFTLEEISKIYLEYTLLRTNAITNKENIKKVAIAYSGGVDSTFLAWLSIESGLDVTLLTAGTEKSADKDAGMNAKRVFHGAKVSFIKFSLDILKEEIYKIVEIVEEYNPISISVAIPQYYIFKESEEQDIFIGQGSDELFGGYSKYITRYNQAEMLIRRDLIKSYITNFEREDKLSRWFNKKIYYPLISPSILSLAIITPLKYKIKNSDDDLRKWIIRLAAKKAGLPEEFYLKKKHSMQYSSRSMQLLKKLSKRQGMQVSQLLYTIYSSIKNSYLSQ